MAKHMYVAAGGGGDLAAAMIVAEQSGHEALFATPIWERSVFDPKIGPRGPSDLRGLEEPSPGLYALTAKTALVGGGYSPIPRLMAECGLRGVYLLDANAGGVGVAETFQRICERHDIAVITVVDVGGDILARGDEEGLLSPTLDYLALIGACSADVRSEVVVLGAGLDGEMSDADLSTARLELLPESDGTRVDTSTAVKWLPLFRWFPSEATGLTLLSAAGVHGIAEMRRRGLLVRLSDATAAIEYFNPHEILERSDLAKLIATSRSLDEVEEVLAGGGITSEREQEREGLKRRMQLQGVARPRSMRDYEVSLLAYSRQAHMRGVDMLTRRRIAEVLALGRYELGVLTRRLERRHPARALWPVWRCQ